MRLNWFYNFAWAGHETQTIQVLILENIDLLKYVNL